MATIKGADIEITSSGQAVKSVAIKLPSGGLIPIVLMSLSNQNIEALLKELATQEAKKIYRAN